jgi:ATP-binding cassette subfamily B protein
VQRIFDDALFPTDGAPPDLALLLRLVLTMIGLFLFSAVLGVTQTWLTSTVGNRVTGDLRVRLFDHLQAMELASSPGRRPGSSSRGCRTTSAASRTS